MYKSKLNFPTSTKSAKITGHNYMEGFTISVSQDVYIA